MTSSEADELLQSGPFASAVLESIPAPMAVLDADGRIVMVNRAWNEFALASGGDPTRHGLGADYVEICEDLAAHGVEGGSEAAAGARAVLSGAEHSFTLDYRMPGTEDQWYVVRIARLLTDSGGAVVLHADISDLVNRALHDALTGLPNRALLVDRLGGALARAGREGGIAILMLDLDHFKVLNDALGHAAGDEVLIATAQRLEEVVRPADTVARLGGDEFVVLCEGLTTAHEARAIAERIVEGLAAPLNWRDGSGSGTVSVSIGIALGDGDSDGAALLRDADAAMYHAKRLGRNRFAFADEGVLTSP